MSRKCLGLTVALAVLALIAVVAGEECGDEVTYLSATIPAYQHLEHQQRMIYEGNPDWVDAWSREAIATPGGLSKVDELLERMSKLCDQHGECLVNAQVDETFRGLLFCDPLPTLFESPLSLMMLRMSIESIATARALFKSGAKPVLFGTLPTGTMDAKATVFEGTDDPIVILNRDIFRFTGAFGKAIANAIPIVTNADGSMDLSADKEEIRQRVRENPLMVAHFAAAIYLLVTNRGLETAPQAQLDFEHNFFYADLVTGLDTFIVAHEVAHTMLGHTGKGTRSVFLLGNSDANAVGTASLPGYEIHEGAGQLQVIDYAKADELAADALGLRLLILSSKDDPVHAAVGAAAADLLFEVIDLVEEYRMLNGLPQFTDDAHPTAKVRARALGEVMTSDAFAGLAFSQMPDFRILARASFNVLAEESRPILLRAFEELGTR